VKAKYLKKIMHLISLVGIVILLVTCGMAFNPLDAENMVDMVESDSTAMRNGTDGGREVILQAWHWNVVRTAQGNWYNILKGMMGEIAEDGFTMLYMPPPWYDDSQWSDGTGRTGGSEGYYWKNMDLNSKYGSKSDLQSMMNEADNYGIKLIFDMVPNHADKFSPTGLWVRNSTYGNVWIDQYSNFFDNTYGGTDGDGNKKGVFDWNSGTSTAYGSDVDLTYGGFGYNAIKHGMQELKNMGADGWRWDYVHGYPATHVDAWINEIGGSEFSVGEYWNLDYNTLVNWSSAANSSVFDFRLKEQLNNSSNPDNWGAGWSLNTNASDSIRERAVTFVGNHDTDWSPGGNHKEINYNVSSYYRDTANAYILLMPGTPCVFWPHIYDWNTGSNGYDYIPFDKLIAARKAAGIRAISGFTKVGSKTWRVYGTNHELQFSLDYDCGNPNPSEWVKDNSASTGYVHVYTKTGGSASPSTYYKIQDRWKGSYLYDDGTYVKYGSGNGDEYLWQKEYVDGTYFRLKNKASGEYMHIENEISGYKIETGSIQSSWWSAQWKEVTATGDWKRIKCKLHGSLEINVENQDGYANLSDMPSNYYSSHWTFEQH
jgi:glycosidase